MTKLTDPTKPVLALSVADAAYRLGLSRSSVLRAIEHGQLRAVRIGRRLVIPVDALDALLATPTEPDDAR